MGEEGGKLEYSSSCEEDGDADWKAAISAVAGGFSSATTASASPAAAASKNALDSPTEIEDDDFEKPQPQILKHYQIKAQKALDDILEKSLVIVKYPEPNNCDGENHVSNGGGVHLFKRAPPGIVFDHIDELQGPRKKPRILPVEEIDEKSKKFRRRLQSIVVEGKDILEGAKDAYRKSLAKLESKEAAAKEAAKKEEERVAALKKVRGEKWLPSVAREMKLKSGKC